MKRFERWLMKNEIPYRKQTAYIGDWYNKDGLHRDELRVDVIVLDEVVDDTTTATWQEIVKASKYAKRCELDILWKRSKNWRGTTIAFAKAYDVSAYRAWRALCDRELEEFWQDRHNRMVAQSI